MENEKENFSLDQTIIDLENLALSLAQTRWDNHHISRMGKVIGLVKGDAKREIDATKQFTETMESIKKHLIVDLKLPDLDSFMVYYENRFHPIWKSMAPLAAKVSKDKWRKQFEKDYKKGKISYHLDSNDKFVVD